MNKINYNSLMEEEIKKIEKTGHKPKLMIHSCCAPCSSHVLFLLSDFFEIGIDFYNPNIDSEKEYDYRLKELERFIEETGLPVKILSGDYLKEDFAPVAKLRAHDVEKGEACKMCYELRMKHTRDLCEKLGYDYFTTTLSISPMKDSEVLNEIGRALSEGSKSKYLFSDFKKKNGYKHSTELSKEYGLYRQDYCGCIFSKIEADRRNNNET